MHGIIFESTNGLSCSKAGTTEGLSNSERHDYSATCGTVSGAQLGASASYSLEDRYEVIRSFLRGTLHERHRIEGAASSIFERIITTLQAPTMTHADPGVISGQLNPSSRTF